MKVELNKELTQRDNCNEPLVFIQEASVAIFAHKIIQHSKLRHKNESVINTTVFSLSEIDGQDKILYFSKNDIAFKVNQGLRKVQIIKLKTQTVQIQFIIQKISQLIVVHEILRRKLCEIGFEQKFKLIKQLGKGATARVYLVVRRSDDRQFAAKIISLKESDNKDYETFINEAKILKCLKNAHIVGIESLYISKKELISVIEYLSGNTLLEELKNDLIKTKQQKIKAIRDIAEGLQHLRQKRIIHRDLKLQNIMVRINHDKSKDYVITDFGLACWLGQKNLIYEKCGTPGYIAPQILKAPRGKVIISHISDMFSLGVICHFIFLLKAVFPYNGNPKQLLISNKKAEFSLQLKAYLPLSHIELEILKRTLQLDVNKRINSQEFLQTLVLKYEQQIGSNVAKKEKLSVQNSERPKDKQEGAGNKHRINLSNSIQVIEKRMTSIEKGQFSNRINAGKSVQKEGSTKQKKSDSFLNKVWNRISSKSEVLKTKQQSTDRRKEMKNFLA